MPWTPPDLDTDPDAVAVRILDGLTARWDDWEPYPGDPLVALAEEIGREISDMNTVAVASIATAVAGIGETVFGVAAFQAEPAHLQVELTLAATDTIGPEFVVVGDAGAGEEVAFALLDTLALPIGVTEVTMYAVEPGAVGNDVPVGPMTIATASATVATAVATSESTDGIDAEDLEAYLDRLTATLATLRFGGVRAIDLATLARSVPGVHRALGVDLYDPAAPATPAERTATVFPVDALGQPVDAGVKANLVNYLEQLREVNFIIHAANPTYTPITITYTAVADATASTSIVEAEINATLGAYLSPATWGSDPLDPQSWTDATVVRFLDVARVIGSVPGVTYVSALTINGGVVDVPLDGPAPLPAAGPTITGTVT